MYYTQTPKFFLKIQKKLIQFNKNLKMSLKIKKMINSRVF